ncbi:TPA: hypothetical protein RTG15_001973 [Campylobacter jejuni]|nr:hypothetical protein [Campylobacter jejuni]HDZ4984811.1 hypothetical protein [Campylobacter jejuni]
MNYFLNNDWIKNSNDEKINVGVDPQKIDLFLSDLIKTFDERILKYCQD